jgi:hypothetical protein
MSSGTQATAISKGIQNIYTFSSAIKSQDEHPQAVYLRCSQEYEVKFGGSCHFSWTCYQRCLSSFTERCTEPPKNQLWRNCVTIERLQPRIIALGKVLT